MNNNHIRILFLSLFLLSFLPKCIFAQEDIMLAYYGKSYSNMKIDSTKGDENTVADFREIEKRLALRMSEVEYQLIFTKTESIFTSVDRLSQGDDHLLDLATNWAEGNGIKYTNRDTKEKLMQVKSFGKLFLISAKFDQPKWELVGESKKIGEFNCFKATTIATINNPSGTFKKLVIAWYAIELPFLHGPIGYGNLPGLIIELNYQNVTYFLKKLDLNPKKVYKIEKPLKGKQVTLEEYEEFQMKASENITFD